PASRSGGCRPWWRTAAAKATTRPRCAGPSTAPWKSSNTASSQSKPSRARPPRPAPVSGQALALGPPPKGDAVRACRGPRPPRGRRGRGAARSPAARGPPGRRFPARVVPVAPAGAGTGEDDVRVTGCEERRYREAGRLRRDKCLGRDEAAHEAGGPKASAARDTDAASTGAKGPTAGDVGPARPRLGERCRERGPNADSSEVVSWTVAVSGWRRGARAAEAGWSVFDLDADAAEAAALVLHLGDSDAADLLGGGDVGAAVGLGVE